MKTTNLFIDFLVIGFLAVIAGLPVAVAKWAASPPDWKLLADLGALLLPSGTAAMYILGMLFNQVSDYAVRLLGALRVLPSSQKLREETLSELNVDYHSAVQLVVTKSTDAYAYLSYRRTVIRIYRAILTSMLIVSLSLVISHVSWPPHLDQFSMLAVAALQCH